MKAFLAWRDQRFEKTHDVRLLAGLAALVEPRFGALLDEADRLTPYAVAFRYPGDVMEPTAEEFAEALAATEVFFTLALEVLPEEVRPIHR